MDITVIIPTFGRPERARSVAQSLLSQLAPGDGIIIVYQKEKPASDEAGGKIRSCYLSRAGLTPARNHGVRETTSDIILFLDDDVTPFDGLVDAHRKSYDDAGVGAVAGYVDDLLFDRTVTESSRFDETTGELVQNFSIEQSGETISFMGANFSVRRSALEQIGLFDERFKGNALWEDVDAAFRIRRAGWRIRFCAKAKVRHDRVVSGGCRSDRGFAYIYHQFANTAYFACRHAPRQYRCSWVRFWWYRLEFLSRRHGRVPRHSPVCVAAGVTGALAGVVRSILP